MTVGGSSSGAVGAGAGGAGVGGMGTGGGPADAAGGASGSGHAGTRDGGEGGEGGESLAGSGGVGGGNTASHCVDVSKIGERQESLLQVIGTGFEAYEGQMIRILATQGEPSYGLGEAPIRDGRFSIFMPGALGDYTAIAVHIDTVRNGACDPDQEFVWQMTTGAAPGDTVWRVTPDALTISDQVGPCSLNGIFDLTTPLPCPSEGAPGLWARVDGEVVGTSKPDVSFSDPISGLTVLRVSAYPYPAVTVQVSWPEAVVPGTFSGNDALVAYQEMDFGTAWYSNRDGGASSVTLTVVGTETGERMVGSFSGTLAADGRPDDLRVVSEGRLDVLIGAVRTSRSSRRQQRLLGRPSGSSEWCRRSTFFMPLSWLSWSGLLEPRVRVASGFLESVDPAVSSVATSASAFAR